MSNLLEALWNNGVTNAVRRLAADASGRLHTLAHGQDAGGAARPLRTDTLGRVILAPESVGAGGAGGGDASAANQAAQIALETAIRDRLPATPHSQPLTDAQLRAAAVPVSGTVTAQTGLSQPLTNTQLRASAVPVASSAPIEVRTNIGALAASATAYSEVMNMGVAADRQHTMLIAHKTGVPSAGENLRIEWSDDQVDWYVSVGRDNGSVSQDAYTSSSSAQMRVKGAVIGRYARGLYINGATPQTALKLFLTAIAGI